MIVEITKTELVNIKTLSMQVGVRFWEDGTPEDMPFRDGDCWCPDIDIDSGTIIDWPHGVEADVYYKVCDSGCYQLLDGDDYLVSELVNEYVPHGCVPGEYGDYVIMQIDGDGKILNWKRPSFHEFPNF